MTKKNLVGRRDQQQKTTTRRTRFQKPNLHYTHRLRPKLVTSFRGPSPRHYAWATRLLRKKIAAMAVSVIAPRSSCIKFTRKLLGPLVRSNRLFPFLILSTHKHKFVFVFFSILNSNPRFFF